MLDTQDDKFADYHRGLADEANAKADEISALKIGDGLSISIWTDWKAGTIIARSAKTLTMRVDDAKLLNGPRSGEPDALIVSPGGFSAHWEGRQRYEYSADPEGEIMKATLRTFTDGYGYQRQIWRKVGTNTATGQGGHVAAGRCKFHDYNF